MPSPASGPLRAARAALVAAATVALGALAHVLGGGAPPSATLLGALAALGFAPAVLATRRRLGPLLAVGLLGAGQAIVHLALGVVGPMTCVVPGVAAGPHAGHGVAGAAARLTELSAGAGGMAVPGGTGAGCAPAAVHVVLGGGTMLALHVLATVVTGLLVAGGERALWWLAAWLRPLVEVLRPVTVPALRRVTVAPRAGRLPAARRAESWSLRGPPVAAPAFA
ncbi:hypothetical protein [Cellulomonas alba]|uniref:MFS transporter n=1 Tax=Cellulomonas alba TaxID=3053467 RepID=A0ABT7SFD3_9CELL|nr:hypothetical protein [Cellulomonas alba]MDM7854904.1 hypothetical protein [Cellulomonas alba]